MTRPSALALALLLSLAIGCGPIGPLPGGALRGELHEGPVDDWSFTEEVETIQLETNPDEPHSVNAWCAAYDDHLYISTSMIAGTDEPTDRQWVKNVLADPRVRVRIDGELYELRADRVTDEHELEVARKRLIAKYEVDEEPGGQAASAWIFRLGDREPEVAEAVAVEAGDDLADERPVNFDTPIGLFEEIGDLHHEITTNSEQAQRYFDQGLTLTFGFNHDAAVRSFREATRADDECAMCWWGVALALGPNINLPMGPDSEQAAIEATNEALSRLDHASPRERAYIEAIASRYGSEPLAERGHRDRAYAEAMREVHEADPADPTAAVLFAESLMMLSPWNYWNREKQPGPHTEELVAVLEAVLAAHPNHIGANHFYIHAVEDPYPEKAEAAADRLADVAPKNTGHLIHMPSHIFWRVGRYEDAADINQRAAASDEDFFSWCRSQGIYDADYYPHNLHFLWAAASAEGRSDLALTSAQRLAVAITPDKLARYPHIEAYVPTPMFALARFGRWDDVLGLPAPAAELEYTTGIWHYVRGLALLRKGDRAGAEAELGKLSEIASSEAMQQLQFVVSPASTLLELGRLHLAGELAAAAGDYETAIARLEEAVVMQDALPYTEPPPWYQQNRLVLGALLIEAGQAAEADAIYRADLEKYPKNGWALFGLSRSLEAQDREAEAEMVAAGFANAWKNADVELESSRF